MIETIGATGIRVSELQYLTVETIKERRAEMKHLCKAAGVDSKKVFPHNLRHLFARVFYKVSKDIARLADVLGHSSIETTRIYLVTTGRECQRWLEGLQMIY